MGTIKDLPEIRFSPEGKPTGNENAEELQFIGTVNGTNTSIIFEAHSLDMDILKEIVENGGFDYSETITVSAGNKEFTFNHVPE